MRVSEENRVKFFVYVVESPSVNDFLKSNCEGNLIKNAVELNDIPCEVVTAINKTSFIQSLQNGLSETMKKYPNLVPVVHISAHGNEDGIQLSSGEFIEWQELRKVLTPINKALNNNLLLCLSCCNGYSGIKMAMFLEDLHLPFFAIIANSGKPLWSDTAVAYSSLYHLLYKGEILEDAVNGMKVASGNDKFFIESSQNSRLGYLDYLNSLNTSNVQSEFRNNL